MRAATIVTCILAAGSPPLHAHHGTFSFDGNTVITLEGSVVRFEWTNPHSSIVLAVPQADGEMREYLLEGDGPSILQPLGVERDSLRPGDRVIAYVSPGRSPDARSVLGREIIKEDGTVLGISVAYARQQERQGLVPATSVLGTWVPDQRALFEFVQSSTSWPLTAAGTRSVAAYDNTAPFAQTACIPATAPALMMYPTAKVLAQQGEQIMLNVDWMGAERIIHMDALQHPPADEVALHGYSVGRFDGATLYVDTRNFSANPIGNMFSIAASTAKHLQEWFTLSTDGQSLQYRFELEDSEYPAGPVTGEFNWKHRPDLSPSSVPCDVETAGRHLQE